MKAVDFFCMLSRSPLLTPAVTSPPVGSGRNHSAMHDQVDNVLFIGERKPCQMTSALCVSIKSRKSPFLFVLSVL